MSGLNPIDQWFKGQFNTKLTPKEEKDFRSWAKSNRRDHNLESIDYDLRGFWKDQRRFAENGHGSDQYKKPNHPTFSDQSMYHNTPAPWGGKFVGGQWIKPESGDPVRAETQPVRKLQFRPSDSMLANTHDPEWLRDYMAKREPGVELVLPMRY